MVSGVHSQISSCQRSRRRDTTSNIETFHINQIHSTQKQEPSNTTILTSSSARILARFDIVVFKPSSTPILTCPDTIILQRTNSCVHLDGEIWKSTGTLAVRLFERDEPYSHVWINPRFSNGNIPKLSAAETVNEKVEMFQYCRSRFCLRRVLYFCNNSSMQLVELVTVWIFTRHCQCTFRRIEIYNLCDILGESKECSEDRKSFYLCVESRVTEDPW